MIQIPDYTGQSTDYDPFCEGELVGIFEPTAPQREIWLAIAAGGDDANKAYNESISIRFEGPLQENHFQRAVNALSGVHEALRTLFSPDGELACVFRQLTPCYEFIDLLQPGDNSLQKVQQQSVNLPFDLVHGPLFRVSLIRENERRFSAILVAHHIVCDGWSLGIALQDLAQIYSQLCRNQQPTLEAPRFSRYAEDRKAQLDAAKVSTDENFWVEQYRHSLPHYDLPVRDTRPIKRSFRAQRIDRELSPARVAALKAFGAKRGASYVATLFAVFSAYISRVSGSQDLAIGMPAAGQYIHQQLRLVGHCVNMLPVRTVVDGKASFNDYLGSVKNRLYEIYDHQDVTFGRLLQLLNVPRDPGRIPLIPITFNFDKALAGLSFEGLTNSVFSNPRQFEAFDWALNIAERQTSTVMELQYNTDLFDQSWISARLDGLLAFIDDLLSQPDAAVGQLTVVAEEEYQRLVGPLSESPLAPLTKGSPSLPQDTDLVSMVRDCAARLPDRVAVTDGLSSLSFAELVQRTDQYGAFLVAQGVSPGDRVGVCLGHHTELPAVLLGIIAAGAAYVPLDPDFPFERLSYMIRDAGLGLVLSHSSVADLELPERCRRVDLDPAEFRQRLTAAGADKPLPGLSSEDPAYVIYTSGSSGKPKGVTIPQRGLTNFLRSMSQQPGLTEGDRLAAVTTASFDISILEMFLPLVSGARCVMVSKAQALDGDALCQLLEREAITCMQATPATWRLLQAANWSGGEGFKALCGGEALADDLAHWLAGAAGQAWNMYGPTETTIWSTCQRIDLGMPGRHIGRPIHNTQVFVVDEHQQLVPQGSPGELLIGGLGVASGYLNQATLTRQKFIANPFMEKSAQGGTSKTLYRTGDAVRMLADGGLQFIGRIDSQIKIRGYRVELGEIESAMRAVPGIDQAVAAVREDRPGDQRLIGYYIASDANAIEHRDLQRSLSRFLPKYMVPSSFHQIKRIPLTPNNKIDRKALPAPDEFIDGEPGATTHQPEQLSTLEQGLKELWLETLNCPSLALDDDFFLNGGHSLIGIQMLGKLQRRFGVRFNLSDLFSYPTIRSLAGQIKTSGNSDGASQTIPKALDPDQNTPVSLQQQRLWYLQKFDPDNRSFNLPAAFRLIGKLDLDRLGQGLNFIIQRHQSLRLQIVDDGASARLAVADFAPLDLLPMKVGGDTVEQQMASVMDWCQRDADRAFSLDGEALFRFQLLELDDQDHVLYFVAHHIIFDGWSFDILLKEISQTYNQGVADSSHGLPALPISFTDFASWQRSLADDQDQDRHLQYWLNQLQGQLPVLDLPTDRGRPESLPLAAQTVDITFSQEQISGLTTLAQQHGATLYMALMTLYQTLLCRYSGQTEVLIGTPISGRNWPEINELLGYFVNTLVIRQTLEMQRSFGHNLAVTKTTLLAAFEHQQTPFETLVKRLNPPRDTSRSPIFQAMFLFQDVRNRDTRIDGIDLSQLQIDRSQIQSDLEFWIKQKAHGAVAQFEFNSALFDRASIANMAGHFLQLVDAVIADSSKALSALEMRGEAERQQLLGQLTEIDSDQPQPANMLTLLQGSFSRFGSKQAVADSATSLSYAELEALAAKVADSLRRNGVSRGELVGVCVPRSAASLAVLIGIFQVGAAYVPLDPQFPAGRLQLMIDDAGISTIVTEQKVLPDSLNYRGKLIELSAIGSAADNDLTGFTIDPGPAQAEDCAYVIYTSGSTGKPKGVVISHRAMTNFVSAMAEQPGLAATDMLAAVTTLSFDISVLELFVPLAVGASVFMVNREQASDGRTLATLLDHQPISLMQATPASWRLLSTTNWTPTRPFRALVGGELLPQDLAQWLLQRCDQVWNMYGPTETTVWSSCHQLSAANQNTVIGKPIRGTSVYVLDENRQPVPAGMVGELWIGGLGVATGYLHRDSLTRDRFIANPWSGSTASGTPNDWIYRTGDAVRLRGDGRLQIIGRLDQQVKIRGYRVELGEIESALAQIAGIHRAIAMIREDQPGDQRLVAYFVPATSPALSPSKLRRQLKQTLPAYMIPQYFMAIEQIPLTPNQKVDRNQLPPPYNVAVPEVDLEPPTTDTEKRIAHLWSELLNVSNISRHNDFFELGGHSLLSMNFIVQYRDQWGYSFSARDIVMNNLMQLAAIAQQEQSADTDASNGVAAQTSTSGWKALMSRITG